MGDGGGSPASSDPGSVPEGEALVSVTVIAPSPAMADSASLALLALGTAGAKNAARERADLAVILVERGIDGVDTVWVESDLEGRFALENCGAPLWVEYY
jgi:thiamine biosynthesis lipoprotein ApbE